MEHHAAFLFTSRDAGKLAAYTAYKHGCDIYTLSGRHAFRGELGDTIRSESAAGDDKC